MHFQLLDPQGVSLSERPLSKESRNWLISVISNELMSTHEFKPEDILKIPRSNGQYDLYILSKKEVLGIGSNSQIYKAYPLSPDGEVNSNAPIAVKFIPAEKGVEAVQGLDRENFALQQLGKKSARVDNAEGSYLCMPYFPGKKITTAEEKQLELTADFNKLTLLQRVDLLAQLGEQVQALHDRKLIHGDIQPANILFLKDKDNKISLQLVDYDQCRQITSKESLLSLDTIHMTLSIRAPEITEKRVGATSDIYSLALNFLFLLGKKDPFIPAYDMKFIHDIKNGYLETSEVKAQINQYLESNEYKAIPKAEQAKAERQFIVRLFDKEYPKERLEKIWLDLHRPLFINLDDINIPDDIAGIPLKQTIKTFLERMINIDPRERPAIDEVNNFIRGVAHLIKNPSLKKTISSDKTWENLITELGKKSVEEKKEEPKNPLLPRSHTQHEMEDENQARAKLAVMLDGMRNIGSRITQQRYFGSRGEEKSQKRTELEARLKGIADLYDANSSKNPHKDYLKMVFYINNEMQSLLHERNQITGSAKHRALKQLLEEARFKIAPLRESSQSAATLIQKGKHR